MSKRITIGPKPRAASAVAAERWVKGGDEREVAMKRLTLDVPEDLHRRIKVACAARGRKMADELRRLLEETFPAS